jgi:C-terminal processing protease CtpA/Prc
MTINTFTSFLTVSGKEAERVKIGQNYYVDCLGVALDMKKDGGGFLRQAICITLLGMEVRYSI